MVVKRQLTLEDQGLGSCREDSYPYSVLLFTVALTKFDGVVQKRSS